SPVDGSTSPNDSRTWTSGEAWRYSCNGQANQQWNVNSNGTISGVQSGRCLDVWGTGNGQQIQLYDCHGQANQRFSLN
ncbi:RICIN domain-containing protein, partial [Dactylosporangium aurantiacum]|uniref:RICIN domain-containing protein n=1 Tax=Dactylosporangium aurantiacum TaxID=35754 RepID=UPI001FDEBE0F